MNKIFTLFFFAIFSFTILFAQNEELIRPYVWNTDPTVVSYEEQTVLIKLYDEYSDFDLTFIRETGEVGNHPIQEINALNEQLDVQSIKKLMPFAGKGNAVKKTDNPPHDLTTIYIIKYKSDMDAMEAVELYKAIPFLEFAEPDYHIQMCVTPNDTDYDNQNSYMDNMNMEAAWDITTGDASQVIGIIDTGVDWDHVDLAPNLFINTAELNGTEGVDDDENGFVDDIRGWDFINEDNDPNDDNSHGTHVAGIACAKGNNNIGVCGASWNSKFMPIKVLQSSGRGSWSTVAQGVTYGSENGSTILNLSLGGYSESLTLKTALENAYYYSFIVAAAGNDSRGIHIADCGPRIPPPAPHYPACYSFVMGVEAQAGFSNFDCTGPYAALNPAGHNYEVRYPGANIYSTMPNNNYDYLSGTSMASPLVSGVVSLLKGEFPNITHEELFVRLIESDVDVEDALSMTLEPKLVLYEFNVIDTLEGGDRDGVADAGETIYLQVTVKNFGGEAENVTATLDFGEFEDTSVATIDDNDSDMEDVSAYARVNNNDNPFQITIDEDVHNNRDIVFEVEFACENSVETWTEEIVLTVQNGIEFRGYFEGLTHLTPNKYYIVSDNAICDSLLIDPGTLFTINSNKSIGVYESFLSNGTPDSMTTFRINNDGMCRILSNLQQEKLIELNYCNVNNHTVTPGWTFNQDFNNLILQNCILNDFESGNVIITLPQITQKTIIYKSILRVHINVRNFRNNLFVNNKKFYDYGTNKFILGSDTERCFNNSIYGNYRDNEFAVYGFYFNLSNTTQNLKCPQNYFGTKDSSRIEDSIYDYFEESDFPVVTGEKALLEPPINAHGHVWKINIAGIDAQDERDILETIGTERKRFDVYFNRSMDVTQEPFLSFGVREPYTQKRIDIDGEWTNWKRDDEVGDALYHLQVATDEDFSNVVIEDNDIEGVTKILSDLDEQTNYFWRVRYKNVGGDWNEWSETYNFRTVLNTTCDAPVIINPEDGDEGIYTSIIFRWENSPYAEETEFQLSTTNDFTNIIKQGVLKCVLGNSFTVENLEANTPYYWRVRYANEYGYSEYTSASFTTYEDELKAPVLVYPEDNATGISAGNNHKKLEIKEVDFEPTYYIKYSYYADFSTDFGTDNVSTNVIYSGVNCNSSSIVYWRARYELDDIYSEWSEVIQFTTVDNTDSQIPDLVSPVDNGEVDFSNDIILEWEGDNIRYQHIQISKINSFLDNVVDNDSYGGHNGFQYTFTKGEIGETYYWRVRTQAYEQNWSDWSEIRSFTVATDNEIPRPLLCVPSDNARGQKTDDLMLKWNNAPGANTVYNARYTAYYDFDYTTPEGLQTLRVASAYDNEYFEAPIEDYRFTFEVQTTSGASNEFMAENGIEQIDMYWDFPEDNNYIGFNMYRFTMEDEETTSDTVMVNSALILDSNYTDYSVVPETDYYYFYRILQTNLEESDPSKTVSAFAYNGELDQPNLEFPPDDSTNMATTIEFDWDEPLGAETYILQVATDEYFLNKTVDEDDIENSYYEVQNLTNDKWYYWRVKAEGLQGSSFWSETRTFKTKPQMPATPELSYPADNATQIPTNLTLDWDPSAYAERYQIQISTTNNFTNIISDENQVTDSEFYTDDLLLNTEYFWRVRSFNSAGTSNWSGIFSFTTDENEYYDVPESWTVTDNTGNNANIVVPGSLQIEIFEREILNGDIIGVFFRDGSEYKCGGYCSWIGQNTAITVWGDNDQTTEKDGFAEDEDYLFRVWDSRAGEEYLALVTMDSGPDYYENNAISIISTFIVPEIETHDISLIQGWNMISTYILPEDNDIENICANIETNLLLIKDQNGNMYFPDLGINQLEEWNTLIGYKLYMLDDDILSLVGLPIDYDTPISLQSGWNMISYLNKSSMDVTTAFEEIEDNLILAKDNMGNLYFPQLSIFQLEQLNQGMGYMLYMTDEDELIYPYATPRKISNNSYPTVKYLIPEMSRTGSNMSLIIDAIAELNGFEIGIWTSESVLVGSGKVYNGKAAITIWGDNEQTNIVDGASEFENLKAIVFDERSSESYEIELEDILSLHNNKTQDNLSYKSDDIILAKAAAQSKISSDDVVLTCKPNPTTGETTIEYGISETSIVSLKVYSVSGQLIQIISDGEMNSGLHSEVFDGSMLPSGVYTIQLLVNGVSVSELLVVRK